MEQTAHNASRRKFLITTAVDAGGLVLAFAIPQAKRFLKPGAEQPKGAPMPAPNAFLHLENDGTLTVLLAHSEMGQSVWTTLPMLIAEELDADWSKIKVEHAPAAPVYSHTAYGLQITGGSSTTWSEFDRYRQVGALTRALLIQAAAQKLGVDAGKCKTENGMVVCGEQKIGYGELAEAAAKLPAPETVALKPPAEDHRQGHETPG